MLLAEGLFSPLPGGMGVYNQPALPDTGIGEIDRERHAVETARQEMIAAREDAAGWRGRVTALQELHDVQKKSNSYLKDFVKIYKRNGLKSTSAQVKRGKNPVGCTVLKSRRVAYMQRMGRTNPHLPSRGVSQEESCGLEMRREQTFHAEDLHEMRMRA